MTTLSTNRLAVRLVRHRAKLAFAVAAIAALFAVAFSVTAITRVSLERAVSDSVTAQTAGRSHQIDVITDDQALHDTFAQLSGVIPIWSSTDAVETADGITPTVLISITDPSTNYGHLLQGAQPSGPGEATVSQAAADDLGLAIGDTIGLLNGPSATRITGIFVIPTRPGLNQIVAAVAASTTLGNPTSYFADFASIETEPLLQEAFAKRTVRARPIESLIVEEQSVITNRVASALNYVLPVTWIIAIAFVLTFFIYLHNQLQTDREGLRAAGVDDETTETIMRRAGLTAYSIGTIAGIGLGIVATFAFRDLIAGQYSQSWINLPLPIAILAVYAVSSVVIMAVATERLAQAAIRHRPTKEPIPAFAWLGLGSVLFAVPRGNEILNITAALGGAAALAIGVVALLNGSIAARFANLNATQRMARRITPARSVVVATVAVLSVLAVGVSSLISQEVGYANAGYNPAQPAGSIVVETVATDDAIAVSDVYEDITGQPAIIFNHPDESVFSFRVTTSAAVACLQQQPNLDLTNLDYCSAKTPSGLILKGIATNVQGEIPRASNPETWTASADIVDSADGTIGIVIIDNQTGEIANATIVQAEPSELLRGNITGAVAPTSNITGMALLDDTQDGSNEMVLQDFAQLAPQDQATVRSVIAGRVGYSLINEDTGFQDYGLGGLGRASNTMLASVMFLLITTWGTVTLRQQPELLSSVSTLNLTPQQKAALIARFYEPLLITGGIAGIFGIAVAWDRGLDGFNNLGFWWLSPLITITAALAVITVTFHRQTRTRNA